VVSSNFRGSAKIYAVIMQCFYVLACNLILDRVEFYRVMEYKMLMKMFFSLIGGLGLFLLGMKYMSEGLQAVAGDRLRSLISLVTSNRFTALGVGVVVTCLVQSSSVTTVMVIGFVNSGLMTLTQAIGVIMGANIGTTITGWILVLAIGKYGLPMLGFSAFVYLFSKNEKSRYIGMAVMGVGMVFFGLELMKNGFKPIRSMPEFSAWFSIFRATSYLGVLKCVMAGCTLTLIVQSSSATLGITMGLASTGVIHFDTAAALVLGENIGTTITAYLASIGTNTNARRASYAHIMFNVVGVLWITSIFQFYIGGVKWFLGFDPGMMVMANKAETYPYIIAGIATVHTGFNIINTAMFIPFVSHMASMLEKLVPEKDYKEPGHLTQLDGRMLETPLIGIEQSRAEILRMGEHVEKMMEMLKEVVTEKSFKGDIIKKIFHREEILDIFQKEIATFLTSFLSATIPHSLAEEGRQQLRMADEYESVSDYVTSILKLHMRLKKANLQLPESDQTGIMKLHDEIFEYIILINKACVARHKEIISKAYPQGEGITYKVRELRKKHLKELSESKKSPLVTMLYSDILSNYRRIKDHMLNIAESLAGDK